MTTHRVDIAVPYTSANVLAYASTLTEYLKKNRDIIPQIITPEIKVTTYAVVSSSVIDNVAYMLVETQIEDNPVVPHKIEFAILLGDDELYESLRSFFKNEDTWELIKNYKNDSGSVTDFEFNPPSLRDKFDFDNDDRSLLRTGIFQVLFEVHEKLGADFDFSFSIGRSVLKIEIKVSWLQTLT